MLHSQTSQFVRIALVLTLFAFGNFPRVKATTSCVNAYQCASDTITDDTVYCTGAGGCIGATIDADRCLCDGFWGCYNGDLDIRDSITCDGDFGCSRATIDVSLETITCNGFFACFFASITATDSVTCSSQNSCKSATISSSVSVTCNSLTSCESSTIITSESFLGNGDVNCEGDQSCILSDITLDTPSTITCNGHLSCSASTIDTANTLICDGPESCETITVQNVENMIASGKTALSGADIDTTGITQFTATLTGENTGTGADILCASGSKCDIHCESETACAGLSLSCEDENCVIFCDEKCQTCPTEVLTLEDKKLFRKRREDRLKIKNKYKSEYNKIWNDFEQQIQQIVSSVDEQEDKENLIIKLNEISKQNKDLTKTSETYFNQARIEIKQLYLSNLHYNGNYAYGNDGNYNFNFKISENSGFKDFVHQHWVEILFVSVFVNVVGISVILFEKLKKNCMERGELKEFGIKYQNYHSLA